MVVFCLMGPKNEALWLPALYRVVVFMLGLAAGRAISIVVDGMPSLMLLVYLLLEIVLGVIGLIMVKGYQRAN